MELLHFNGPVWRPPFESTSQLLQVTAGCSHRRCKFCSLYGKQKFRMSPLSEVENDLQTIRQYQPRAHRVFLTGANPFVLTTGRLTDIGLLIRKYLGKGNPTIGCLSRITDIRTKSVDDIKQLRHLGYDYISIGTESGDDDTLLRMQKGYLAADIIEQCQKLDDAGMHYNFTYIAGLAGHGYGERNALRSAEVFSRVHPASINIVSLTIFAGSELYKEQQRGEYVVAGEHERLDELITFVKHLKCRTQIIGNTVSNPVTFTGYIPNDRKRLVAGLQKVKETYCEEVLGEYRNSIGSL